MPKSNPKKQFLAELNKPIRSPVLIAELLIAGQSEETKEKARAIVNDYVSSQRLERLQLLAAHYGVSWESPHPTTTLLLNLAEDLVEGFKVNIVGMTDVRGPGRRRESAKVGTPELFAKVEELRARSKLTVAAACQSLTSRKGTWYQQNPESLETRYYEQKRKYRETKGNLNQSPHDVLQEIRDLCS